MQLIVFWLGYRGCRKASLFLCYCDKQLHILAYIYPCFVYFIGHFTLILLQECNIFNLVLLQTFATISIYWHLYT